MTVFLKLKTSTRSVPMGHSNSFHFLNLSGEGETLVAADSIVFQKHVNPDYTYAFIPETELSAIIKKSFDEVSGMLIAAAKKDIVVFDMRDFCLTTVEAKAAAKAKQADAQMPLTQNVQKKGLARFFPRK